MKNRSKDKAAAQAVTLSIRIQPRASKNELVRMEGGGFKIRLMAPPVDNAANEALVRFLADAFSIPKAQVEIVSGHTARDKRVKVCGITDTDVTRVLNNPKE
jgi:hypothetical protein